MYETHEDGTEYKNVFSKYLLSEDQKEEYEEKKIEYQKKKEQEIKEKRKKQRNDKEVHPLKGPRKRRSTKMTTLGKMVKDIKPNTSISDLGRSRYIENLERVKNFGKDRKKNIKMRLGEGKQQP